MNPEDLLLLVTRAMPFGKHQGKPLGQVPRDYVQWLLSSGALDKPDNQQLREAFDALGFLAAQPQATLL